MTPAELVSYRNVIDRRHVAQTDAIDQVAVASATIESSDHRSDAYAEALFLRAFTAYEKDIENLFLHYVTGGLSLDGKAANTYLNLTDEAVARRVIKAGFTYLSWANPRKIQITAETYIENGWPVSSMINAKSQILADCERVRNRIAHSSDEALANFNIVQRNLLQTERLFPITPGQFLRIRNSRLKKLHIGYYIDIMNETLCAIFTPPP